MRKILKNKLVQLTIKNHFYFGLILIIISFNSAKIFAQGSSVIDSLENQLSLHNDDTIRVNLLCSLAWNYINKDLEKASSYNEEATLLSKKLKYGNKNGSINSVNGLIKLYEGKPDSAFVYFNKAQKIFEKNGDKKSLASNYNNIAMAYSQKMDAENCIANYKLFLKMATELNDKKLISKAYSNLGAIYQDTQNLDSALFFHELSMEIKKELKDSIGMAITYYNKGAIYSIRGNYESTISFYTKSAEIFEKFKMDGNLAQVYNSISGVNWKIRNIKPALNFNKKALELAQKAKMEYLLPEIFFNRGLILDYLKNDESEKYYNLAIEKGQITGAFNIVCESLLNLGTIYQNKGDSKKAEKYFIEALAYAEKSGFQREIKLSKQYYADFKIETKDTTNLKQLINDIINYDFQDEISLERKRDLEILAKYHVLIGNKDKAIEYYQQMNFIIDSIFDQDIATKFLDIQEKYETIKKEKQIELLEQENRINTLLLSERKYQIYLLLVALLIVVLIVVSNFYRIKLNKRIAAKEQMIREADIERKTIMDTENRERERIAQELHDGVNGNISALRLYINRQMHLYDTKDEKNTELKTGFVEMQNQIDEIINQVRNLSHELLPKDFNNHLFSDIIQAYFEKIRSTSDIHWELIIDNVNGLPIYIRFNIYRIINELCRNIISHSKANAATVQLLVFPEYIQLLVEDNGIGFKPNNESDGIGLKNIQSRVKFLNGKINIESNKINTSIIIEIPVENEC
jgi:two-component system, NarL family, sensor kinase